MSNSQTIRPNILRVEITAAVCSLYRTAQAGRYLLGDPAYDCIPAGAKMNLIALGITHHGDSCAGSPSRPSAGGAAAAVSFGLPNRYHHPNWDDIEKHALAGWRVTPKFVAQTTRGDAWLP